MKLNVIATVLCDHAHCHATDTFAGLLPYNPEHFERDARNAFEAIGWRVGKIVTECPKHATSVDDDPTRFTANAAARYIETGGEECPRCQSTDIVGESIDIEGGYATQRITCSDCQLSWRDVYTLTSTAPEHD